MGSWDARAAAAALARRQHGLLTTAQLSDAGIDPRTLARLVRPGLIAPMRRGVYRLPGAPATWAQAALAAVLAAGPDALTSHLTAARLWGLLGPGSGPGALRSGLVDVERLRRMIDTAGGSERRPLLTLRCALADRPAGFDAGDSAWEREMDHRGEALGLPAATRQHRVVANGHTYVLDRAIPDLRIGVEWNGFAAHGGRSGFDHDSDRRADLTAAGWHMLDFTSRSTPERVVAAVLGAVHQRQAKADAGLKPTSWSAASAGSSP